MTHVAANETITVRLHLNGEELEATVPADASLTRLLRDRLGRTETKIGCEVGRCGACMVLMDGQAVNSCLIMAWRADGAEIVTAAGLDELPVTKTVRQSLAEESAFQCGYCAPGFVVSLVALLTQNPDAGRDDILTALEGNICRCTGYHSILRGALLAADRIGQQAQKIP
ncbi:(2Fe-2S)-binding protein [Mesorhizobium xinjiangense]|uniref:(2Fe-2S)-binding protein n=1 Tax=Mesorhizobium xinjiangense TaxID=2678685 RepID=UPI0012EDAB98|nr:(2Fe-2S)-binding protein [Mesorhizobium xinjiangense]